MTQSQNMFVEFLKLYNSNPTLWEPFIDKAELENKIKNIIEAV